MIVRRGYNGLKYEYSESFLIIFILKNFLSDACRVFF